MWFPVCLWEMFSLVSYGEPDELQYVPQVLICYPVL